MKKGFESAREAMTQDIQYTGLAEAFDREAIAVSESVGLPCVIGGRPMLPLSAPRTEFWFRCGVSLDIIKDERWLIRTLGILQFTIYGQEGCDIEDLQRQGDLIAEAFGRKNLAVPPDGYVEVERMDAMVLRATKRRKIAVGIADAGFDYYRST